MISIPAFENFSFEEKSHIYKLENVILPSVSTIMNPLSKALYENIDASILNKAADRGMAVHNAIENYILFGIVDIDDANKGYLDAFIQWYEDKKPKPIVTESRVYHRVLRYAGTGDLIAEIDGKNLLIDYKTSATVNKMLTGVQLEAYSKAYDSHGVKVDGKMILHLKSDGKYQEIFYKKNDIENWEVFCALLKIYGHIKKYK